MPLSWNEIKSRALAFSKTWADAGNEDAEAKPFLIAFFEIFGITDKRIASFEHAVRKYGGAAGYVDLFWPGILLVEMKSRGKNLDRAYVQAMDYFPGLAERDLPRYVLVCDFARFRLYDLAHPSPASGGGAGGEGYHEFPLAELYQNVKQFGFIAGYTTQVIKAQDPINIKAAFPYVNGKLFEAVLPPASFDAAMREALLDLCALDWSIITPAIFGSLFQSIMDDKARRNLGAHYTSEENILKLIKPLFLDALWAEFEKIRKNRNRLFEFHKKLRTLKFFDPACGCGNFLVITYRELRLLELEVLRAAYASGQQMLDIHQLIAVDVDQFYGIEIEDFPAQIAQVALWLTDHQMNLKVSEEFGAYFVRILLTHSATIVNGNALRLDWNEVLPAEKCGYLLGNPPFVGAKFMNDAQREDTRAVFAGIDNAGLLDFVAAWYVKAARYMANRSSPFKGEDGRGMGVIASSQPHPHPNPPLEGEGTVIRAAFVSTNSITQGEQVGALWGWLLAQGVKIHFAHRTFSWSNEARGKAAVHCVIIGFYLPSPASGRGAGGEGEPEKTIFEYESIKGEAHAVKAANINPYLVDAPDVVLPRRSKALCDVPEIGIGNKPIDGGYYLFTPEEKAAFLKLEPAAEPYFRRWIGADEFINGYERWCLWLGDCPPEQLRAMPEAMKRVQAVKAERQASKLSSAADSRQQ